MDQENSVGSGNERRMKDGDGDGKKFGILRFYLFSVVRDSISIYLAPL